MFKIFKTKHYKNEPNKTNDCNREISHGNVMIEQKPTIVKIGSGFPRLYLFGTILLLETERI